MTSPDLSNLLPSEERIAGPFLLFNSSFEITYFNPDPARNASVLMRARYIASHTETQLGKKYAQTPPLHLHFSQAESFVVLQGRCGETQGYDLVDKVWTKGDGIQTVSQWVPHTFWPIAKDSADEIGTKEEQEEDGVLLVWAHPRVPGLKGEGIFPPSMDWLFFQSLLGSVSDVHEGKTKLDLLQLMLMQQESETAPILLPTWWILGAARWWVPWKLQGILATVAKWQGKAAILEQHVGADAFRKWSQVQTKPKLS